MSAEKMRADFEAWLAGSGLSYAEGIGAWYGWQASRAALVVELPESFEMDDFAAFDRDETIAAIEAAGVGFRKHGKGEGK